MAKKVGEVYVEVATRGYDRVNSSLGKLRKRLMLIGAAAAGAAAYGFARLIHSSVQSAAESEHAYMMLETLLKNVKTATPGAVKGLSEYANELQKITGYSDEVIMHGMAQLATFQLNEKQIKDLTPRLLDMAAALEMAGKEESDVHSISIALGKGMTGQFAALRKYGVMMSDLDMKTADYARKLEILDENYRDSGRTLGTTYIGHIRKLGNVYDELKESIGRALLPKFGQWTQRLIEFAESGKAQQIADDLADIAKAAIDVAEALDWAARSLGLFGGPLGKETKARQEQMIGKQAAVVKRLRPGEYRKAWLTQAFIPGGKLTTGKTWEQRIAEIYGSIPYRELRRMGALEAMPSLGAGQPRTQEDKRRSEDALRALEYIGRLLADRLPDMTSGIPLGEGH